MITVLLLRAAPIVVEAVAIAGAGLVLLIVYYPLLRILRLVP